MLYTLAFTSFCELGLAIVNKKAIVNIPIIYKRPLEVNTCIASAVT